MFRKLWCGYLSLVGLTFMFGTYTLTFLVQDKARYPLSPSLPKERGVTSAGYKSRITILSREQPQTFGPAKDKAQNMNQSSPEITERIELSSNEKMQIDDQSESSLVDPWFTSPYVCSKRSLLEPGTKVKDSCLASKGSDKSKIRGGNVKTIGVITNCDNCSREQAGAMALRNIHLCSYSCRVTTILEEADTVIFYVFKLKTEQMIPRFIRPPGQRWVMLTQEAAVRTNNTAILDTPSLRGQFNWTVTYKLDSDIPRPYGQLQWQPLGLRNYDAIFHRKRVTAAWFVSHCNTQSKRQQYVRQMQEIAPVHLFGLCGDRNCSKGYNKRGADDDICFPMLSKSYFFYLAFENSLCDEYVTEKFFKIFKKVDIVPVVRGGTDYKRHFPPNTFVDTSDFKSAYDLARYLVALSKDKTRYLSMLKAKSMYKIETLPNWYCRLCEKMHVDTTPKWYPDVRTWFVNTSCHKPQDIM